MIVQSNTPAVARTYVRLVLLLAGWPGPALAATVEVRPVPDHQGRLL